MRRDHFRTVISVSLFALMSSAAIAQTPPAALSDLTGVTFEGEIGGMSVWSVPGVTDLFAVTPDGRTIVRGSIFSGSGRDIGAVYTGSPATELLPRREIVEIIPFMAEPASQVQADQAPPQMVDAGPGFSDLRGTDSCQSPIIGGGPVFGTPRIAGWDRAGNGAPPSLTQPPLDANGLVDGAAVARGAEQALEGFSADERRDTLMDLVNRLSAATTQEEFLRSVASWRSDIDRIRQERGLSRLYSEDGAAVLIPSDPNAITTTVLPDPETVSVAEALLPPPVSVSPLDEESPGATLEERLLQDARMNALWFSVGANDVPAVYAFLDPTCPYSARAVTALSEEIGAGQIQLRVILAPVISERAAGLIAGILTSDRPPLALFDHMTSLAQAGRSDVDPAEFSGLPGPVQAGIKRNYDMIRDYRIPGVPFFVYETAEGAKVVSGAPDGIGFPGALIDPYTGTK
jgi:hypothetical protein